MKTIELPIKRGDRVWVKVYNERNGSFTSRMAEVISILQMYVSGADVPYVALRYLDDPAMDVFPMNKSPKYATSLFLNNDTVVLLIL